MTEPRTKTRQRREIGSSALSRSLERVLAVLGAIAPPIALALSALCALSAVALLPFAAFHGFWMIALFEAVVLLAGIIGAVTARGRFPGGPAISLLCVGGTISSLAILTEPALVTRLLGSAGRPLEIGGFRILPLMLARFFAGAIIIDAAILIAWARCPGQSAGYLLRSAASGAAALIVAVLSIWRAPEQGPRAGARGILDRVAAIIDTLPDIVLIVLVIAAFFVALALVSASGHCLIRSFEVARLDDPKIDADAS